MTRIAIVLGLVVGAVGCKKENPQFCIDNPGEDGCPDGDGGPDGPPMMCDPQVANSCPAKQLCSLDNVCVAACFGSGPFEVCLTALPTTTVTLPATLDTTSAGECGAQPTWPNASAPPDVCLVVGTTVAVSNAVAVTGARPLVIASLDTIAVTAVLDAASHVNDKTGPASNQACNTDGTDAESAGGGGGGGAGGSFVDIGSPGADAGPGGTGDSNSTNAGTADSPLAMPLATLRGGCTGQNGGIGGGQPGLGGIGGGAVYVAARTTLSIGPAGGINASGGGGTGNSSAAGGGGGGSGGMIVLSAGTLSLDAAAFVMANGGGGAAGGGSASGGDGLDPTSADVTVGGTGGSGGGGGPGGIGSAATSPGQGGGGGGSGKGGGGGGGGPGLIYSVPITTGHVSPDVTPPPT